MAEAGWGGDETRMEQLKIRLRVAINAILDQKIHAGHMTEDEARHLMMDTGYQEEGEAAQPRRLPPAPYQSPPFPFSEHLGPIIGIRDDAVWPLMEALEQGLRAEAD